MFLRELFVSSRPELPALAALGRLGEQVIDLQWRAQRAGYLTSHPDAEDEIVELTDGTPVGRCWTAQSTEAVYLLDLAVHPGHRRRGIASGTLALLADRADHLAVPLRLHVWAENHSARALYTAVGFRETGAQGGHVTMERTPNSEAGAA